jgi:homopolymeric O-antigen transport system permease protein
MTTPRPQVAAPVMRIARSRRSIRELLVEGFSEILNRRRLIRYMVLANMKRTHADTALGQLWWVLDPLFLMVIYVVLVQVIFQRSTPDYPLFIFAAILPWKWFSISLGSSAGSVTGREGLIRQIQFPKIVLPVAAIVAATVSFAISLLALAVMYLPYLDRLSPWLIALPLIAAVQFAFSLALGFGLAAMNVFYRDVQVILGHVVRLWFYASPGLWALSDLEDNPTLHTLLSLNPMAPVLESYRAVIYGTTAGDPLAPDFAGLAYTLVVSAVVILFTVVVFKRTEPAFAKVV